MFVQGKNQNSWDNHCVLRSTSYYFYFADGKKREVMGRNLRSKLSKSFHKWILLTVFWLRIKLLILYSVFLCKIPDHLRSLRLNFVTFSYVIVFYHKTKTKCIKCMHTQYTHSQLEIYCKWIISIFVSMSMSFIIVE